MRKRIVARCAGVVGTTLWALLASCGSSSPGSGFSSGSDAGTTASGDGGGFTGLGNDGGGGSVNLGAPTTCIVGTKGCLCDSTGGCAPGLTCTPQTPPEPNLCCNGSDCGSSGAPIGKSCGAAAGSSTCTPGITIPAASGGNDSCGYPSSGFNESSILCGITASGGGTAPAVIQVFYNDEHALPLGCQTSTYPVSPLSVSPEALSYPLTGDPACVDTDGRPMRPVLFITDISTDTSCTDGDMQKGGPAYDPVAVFGSWKAASEGAGNVGSPSGGDPSQNDWNLTSSADPVPSSAKSACTQGFGTELRFEVGLISGHSYRIQVVMHDGDQTRGADSGEACATFCAGSGSLCDPGVTECTGGTACPSGTTCVEGCCLNNPR